jgi:hypothetical protein
MGYSLNALGAVTGAAVSVLRRLECGIGYPPDEHLTASLAQAIQVAPEAMLQLRTMWLSADED